MLLTQPTKPRGRGRRRLRAGCRAVASGYLLPGLLLFGACASPAVAPASPRPLVIVGLDAADWLWADPLIEAGALPTLARLKAAGRAGVLRATPPLVSPILWTTLATGRPPEEHRVLDFMVDVPGGQAPVGSTERRVSALWNLFSDAGRRVAVVGWWATHPAESVDGTIVSDRVAPQLLQADAAPPPAAIAPPEARARLLAAIVRPEALERATVEAYLPLRPGELEAGREALTAPAGGLYRDPVAHLMAIVASTRTLEAMAETLVAEPQPDLLLVYLEAIDSLSHRFVRDPRGPGVIARAYRDADAFLARLAERVRPDTWIVVVSDHGFYPPDAAIAEDPAALAGPATAWHRPWGLVAAAEARALLGGSTAPAGAPAPGPTPNVDPLDLAPTLLHAADLPASLEMPGRVVSALLPPEAAAREPRRVPSLEPKTPRPSPASPAATPDAAAVERLRALGYVGGATSALAQLNLAEVFYRRGDLAAAERELRGVLEQQPDNVAAELWLARVLADQGRAAAALAVYERALAASRPPPGDLLLAAVDLAAATGRLKEAQRLVALAAAGGARATPAERTARATLAAAQGRPREAERELRAALAEEPLALPPLARLFDLLAAAGRGAEAVAPAERAVALAPRSAPHLALLGAARLAAGADAAAEEALRQAVALAPEAESARLELARARLRLGRASDALTALEPLAPTAERSVLQAAALTRLERWGEAVAAYEHALARGPATPELLNGRGWAHLKAGHRAQAAADFQRSLALRPDQPRIRTLLAEAGGAS